MDIDALHKVETNPNFRVLLIAPFETQVRNMFTRINELIKESPMLKNTVTRNVKSPYIMEFSNGSSIYGFTTGDDASSIRGQRAKIIVGVLRQKLQKS